MKDGTGTGADHIRAVARFGAILHIVSGGLACKDFLDIFMIALAILGMDMLLPNLPRPLHILGRKTEEIDGSPRPTRDVVLYVTHEDIAVATDQRKNLEQIVQSGLDLRFRNVCFGIIHSSNIL